MSFFFIIFNAYTYRDGSFFILTYFTLPNVPVPRVVYTSKLSNDKFENKFSSFEILSFLFRSGNVAIVGLLCTD